MVSAVLSGAEERTGMKKELLTVKEIGSGIAHGLKSIQRTYRKERSPCIGLVALSLLHLDTYGHIWIHLTNSHHPCKTVWSAPEAQRRKKGSV